jgi:sulfite reductase (NADPH) hemoprotein beta-component
VRHNVAEHKIAGYRNVFVALKEPGAPPGDIDADQMDAVADLADRYSFGQIRATHHQNLLLADVRQADLYPLWHALKAQNGWRRR